MSTNQNNRGVWRSWWNWIRNHKVTSIAVAALTVILFLDQSIDWASRSISQLRQWVFPAPVVLELKEGNSLHGNFLLDRYARHLQAHPYYKAAIAKLSDAAKEQFSLPRSGFLELSECMHCLSGEQLTEMTELRTSAQPFVEMRMSAKECKSWVKVEFQSSRRIPENWNLSDVRPPPEQGFTDPHTPWPIQSEIHNLRQYLEDLLLSMSLPATAEYVFQPGDEVIIRTPIAPGEGIGGGLGAVVLDCPKLDQILSEER